MRVPHLAIVALLALPAPAFAFGWGGHVETAEGGFDEVANLPGNQALRGDATAKRAYMWGSWFPDWRLVYRHAPAVSDLKNQLEQVPGVRRVRLDLTEVTPAGWDTHDLRLGLHMVNRARATGDPHVLAFALGCLAHGAHDRDEQTFAMQGNCLRGRAGDPAIGPSVTGDAAGHSPGLEAQFVNEAMRESVQPASRLKQLRSAQTRLTGRTFLSAVRSRGLAARLKAFYWDAFQDYARSQNPSVTLISERGYVNAVNTMEAASVAVPAIFNKESVGRAGRILKSRYLDLAGWADIIYLVSEVLARAITLGTQGVLNLADLVLFACKGKLLEDTPFYDVIEGAVHRGRSWRRVERRYRNHAEFQRVRASGIFERSTYPYPAIAHRIALDVTEHGPASRWLDWPLINTRSMRGVAAQSYLVDPVPAAPARPSLWQFWRRRRWRQQMAAWRQQHERGFHARAGGFVVADVRWLDAATGQPIAELASNDHGRQVRVELDVQGLHERAQWLYAQQSSLPFEVVVVEDALSGSDVVLERATTTLGVDQVDPMSYGSVAPPVLSLDVTVPLSANTRGYHVELHYDGQRVFTTDWDAVAARGATNPHYAAHYGTYDPSGMHSLKIDGR